MESPWTLEAINAIARWVLLIEVAVNRIKEMDSLISATETKLSKLDEQRKAFQYQLNELKHQRAILIKQTKYDPSLQAKKPSVTIHSSESEKISLFRSLFRGREDVFARRFESVKTGKRGYQPCCRNEWVKGVCQKPKIKCSDCDNRNFFPITDDCIEGDILEQLNYTSNYCAFYQVVFRSNVLPQKPDWNSINWKKAGLLFTSQRPKYF